MKKGLIYGAWVLAAVLLVTAGVGCLITRSDTTQNIAVWIGLIMVISGLLQLGVNFLMRDTVFGDRTFLTKGVITVVVGVIVMCQSFIAGQVISFLISMMVLVDGVSVIGAAITMSRDKVWGRGWLWLLGIVEAVLGIAGFLKPELLGSFLGWIIGISLIYEGIVLAYTFIMGMKWRKLMNL